MNRRKSPIVVDVGAHLVHKSRNEFVIRRRVFNIAQSYWFVAEEASAVIDLVYCESLKLF